MKKKSFIFWCSNTELYHLVAYDCSIWFLWKIFSQSIRLPDSCFLEICIMCFCNSLFNSLDREKNRGRQSKKTQRQGLNVRYYSCMNPWTWTAIRNHHVWIGKMTGILFFVRFNMDSFKVTESWGSAKTKVFIGK